MENDTTNKKADKNLNENELVNVTGGATNGCCADYNNSAECNADLNCTWNGKSGYCYFLVD